MRFCRAAESLFGCARDLFFNDFWVSEPIAGQQKNQPEQLLELGSQAVDDVLWIVDHALVGDQSELHLPVVREDADPHANIAGLRHPDHLLVDSLAGEITRLR